MFRVTSLTNMPEAQLNRWIKRIALLFVVVLIAFVAFYVVDRFRMPAPAIVDQELTALEDAVRADPANTVARGQLGERYFTKGRYEDAIAQFTLLIDANKEVEQATFGRARAYQELGELDKAIPDYETVVEIAIVGEMASIDPVLAASYYGLGTIAMEQGRTQDAVDQLTKAAQIARTDGDTLYALAMALLAAGQPEQAIERLDLVIRLIPATWPEPYAALERAYTETGDPAMAQWAGAMAAFAGGDTATAKTQLEALLGGERALEATAGLGLIAEAVGDTAGAAEWFRKALAINPDYTTAQLGLSRVTVPEASQPVASPVEGTP